MRHARLPAVALFLLTSPAAAGEKPHISSAAWDLAGLAAASLMLIGLLALLPIWRRYRQRHLKAFVDPYRRGDRRAR